MRAPSTQPYRAMGGTRSGTGKTGTGKKWAVNTAEDRAARKTLKGGRVYAPFMLCISGFPATAFCGCSGFPPCQGSCPMQQNPFSFW